MRFVQPRAEFLMRRKERRRSGGESFEEDHARGKIRGGDDPGVFARAIVALDQIPLRLVSQASSRRTFTFVLDDAQVPEAMTRLHDAFFSEA